MILMPRFYSERMQTFRFLGLLVYAPYPPSPLPAQHPPQKKKPKLLFHASKEKIVHCKSAFQKDITVIYHPIFI